MMVELIVTSGALVGDIIQRYRGDGGARLCFEKIMPGDPRGIYGEYLIWLEEADAATGDASILVEDQRGRWPAAVPRGLKFSPEKHVKPRSSPNSCC